MALGNFFEVRRISAETEISLSSVSATRGSKESKISTLSSDSTLVALAPQRRLASMRSTPGESLWSVHVAFKDGADSWLAEELAKEGGDPLPSLRRAASAVM